MPIYKVETTTETNPKYRLVNAANQAQALKHVAGKLFKVEPLDAEQVADMFVTKGVTAVEDAGKETK